MDINQSTPRINANLGDNQSPRLFALDKSKKESNEQLSDVKDVKDVKSVKGLNELVEGKEKEKSVSSVEDVENAVQKLNDHVQVVRRNLQFSVDETTGKQVVVVSDSDTNDVIRQIPSEEALELSRRVVEDEVGRENDRVANLFSSIA